MFKREHDDDAQHNHERRHETCLRHKIFVKRQLKLQY